ncbi:MAG: hypothetical protein M3Y41_04955 [Pseudomonadota bacterium]|nr:hypothetical protein [Pseudomonadota bacterium]
MLIAALLSSIAGFAFSAICAGILFHIRHDAGGFAATPGAPVSMWCGMKGWDKLRQRGVFQPFILVMQFIALATIAAMRGPASHAAGFDTAIFAYVPAGLIGTWWGLAFFRRLTDRQFATVINLLLIVSGVSLMA